MTYCSLRTTLGSFTALSATLLLALGGAAQPQPRTLLVTDVPPEVRVGRTFVPLRAAAEALGAEVEWLRETRTVRMTLGATVIRLRPGDTSATVNGRRVQLDVAPYIRQGRTMVPLRFSAEALGVNVAYEPLTQSVLIGPDPEGRLWVLPLESMRAGIVVHDPQPDQVVTSPLVVHGQANVFEGNVIVELRDGDDRVLARGIGTGAMGAYGPFEVELRYTPPAEGARAGRVFVFAPSAKDDRLIAFSTTVPVRIH